MLDLFAITLLRIFRFFGIISFLTIVSLSIYSIIIVLLNLFFDYNYYKCIETFIFFIYNLFTLSDLNNNSLIIIVKKLVTAIASIVFIFGLVLVYVQIIDKPIKYKLKYIIRALMFRKVRENEEEK